MMKRFLVVLGLVAAVLLGALGPETGSAYIDTRNRPGSSTWSPQAGFFEAYGSQFDIRFKGLWLEWWWDLQTHRSSLGGTRRAFEFKAATDSGAWGSSYDGFWQHTLPSNCAPYLDILLFDSKPNFGVGCNHAAWMNVRPNEWTTYWSDIGVKGPDPVGTFSVRAAAAHRVTDESCWSWCVFPDYTQRLRRGSDTTVRTWYSWKHNYLSNESFESGTTGWGWWQGQNVALYSGGAYDRSWFLETNRGSRGSQQGTSIFQDVNMDVRAGDHYVAESAVRCPTGQPYGCFFKIAIWGRGGSTPEEVRDTNWIALPSNGLWYICRLDEKHGFGSGFSYNHSSLRFEIYITGSENFDFDGTHLGLYVGYADTPSDSDGPQQAGNHCSR